MISDNIMGKIVNYLKNSLLRCFIGGVRWIYRRYLYNYRTHMGYCDPTAVVSKPLIIKNPKNVYLYEHTKIVDGVILATNAKFILKKYSSAAYGLKVITGAHERRVGRFFRSIKESEKAIGLDKDVIVEEDCWIGVNVTLLAGVTVRRGSTVAAGAVVTKSTPPYSINGGVPCKFIKFYWSIEQIIDHENQLYKEGERYSREQLEQYFYQYQKK